MKGSREMKEWCLLFCLTRVFLNSFPVIFFSELAVLEENKNLQSILSDFQMPTMKYGTLKVAGFGETCLKTFDVTKSSQTHTF